MMKHLWSAAVALVAMAMAFPSSAEWRIWRSNPEDNHDWTNPKNYSDGIAPVVGDTIIVAKGLVVTLDPSDTASWNLLNNPSTRVQLRNGGSFVIIDTDDDVTFEGSIATAWDDVYCEDRDNGGIKKRGEGLLTLQTSLAKYGYFTGLFVEGGSLKLDVGSEQTIGVLSVNEGCVAELTSPLTIGGFAGAGTIKRTQETPNPDYISLGLGMYEFSGQLVGNIIPYFQNRQLLTSEGMSLGKTVTVRGNQDQMLNGAYLGVKVFGTPGEPSSVGKNSFIMLSDSGSYIRYLGTGETTTKDLKLGYTRGGHAVLDGGETGGLLWNGNMLLDGWRNEHVSFIFTGDHTTPCVFGGYCFDDGAGYKRLIYITKDGTGTWRFTGDKECNDVGFSGIAVKNGTLQFDTIAEKGTNSSLGKANKTMEDYSGADSADDHLVPYAYVLGGNGDALMEYTGATAAKVTTRPAVLDGKGGFKSSAAAFDFTGVTAKGTGANTLLLDGDAVVNTVRDVTDGTGTVGIEKRGSGTWVLEGNNAFSGPVAVKAGTLRIASTSKPYRWYRFNIEQVLNGDSAFELRYLGLFDKDGLAVSDGLTKGSSLASLLPGQVLGERRFFATTTGSVKGGDFDEAFVYSSSLMGGYFLETEVPWVALVPKMDDDTTWGRIVMRLPENANPVTSYDFLRGTSTAAWSWRANYQILAWSIDASLDGQKWTTVSASQSRTPKANVGTYQWASDDETVVDYANHVHKTGMPIASSVVVGTLPTTTAWSVDAGATLVNEDDGPLVVSKLTVDATKGVGAFVNFAFAETGVLDISNLAFGKGEYVRTFTGDFSQTSGFAEHVPNWTITVNGSVPKKYSVAVVGSTITVKKNVGSCIIFR